MIMKKVLFVALSALVFVACTNINVSKNEEETTSEQRDLTGFECIVQQGSMDVKYQQSDKFSVVVKSRKSDVKNVITKVEGNALYISMKGSSKMVNFGWADGDDVTVYVTSPDLIGVELSGSGDFDCKQLLDTDKLAIVLKGSGDIEFTDVLCDDIDVSVVGSGDVKVQNVKTQKSKVSLVGSGEVKMNQADAKLTQVELKGSGDIKLDCKDCDKVESRLLGSGDIKLSGNVNTHQSYKRGSGDLDTEKLSVQGKQ